MQMAKARSHISAHPSILDPIYIINITNQLLYFFHSPVCVGRVRGGKGTTGVLK